MPNSPSSYQQSQFFLIMTTKYKKLNPINVKLICLYTAYTSLSVFGYWKSGRGWLSYLESWFLETARVIPGISIPLLTTTLIASLLAIDVYFELWCEQRPICGIPRIPRGSPIAGNLFQQGSSAALAYWKWDLPVFQLRLGTKRVVVANTYDSIYHLWQTNWKANISRPVYYTFHKVMSTSQGTTIGTTPYCESWRRMRKTVAAGLNVAAIKSYSPILDRQSARCIGQLEAIMDEEVSVHEILKSFALLIVFFISEVIEFRKLTI